MTMRHLFNQFLTSLFIENKWHLAITFVVLFSMSLHGQTWSPIGNSINGMGAYYKEGYTVAMSADGSRAVVGTPNGDANGYNSGQVRMFEFNGNNWVQLSQAMHRKMSWELRWLFLPMATE